MRQTIFDLKQVKAVKKFGRKAVNLAGLQRWGFNVPLTGALSSDALQYVLKRIPAVKQLKEDHPLLEAALNQIREEILKFSLPGNLERELGHLIDRFASAGIQRIAVRSSAVSEDRADFSFAGQYATVLDVPLQINEIWQAVKTVWASLFNPAIWEYCQKIGLPSPGLQMGVILQAMVEARFAGVAFSVDPNHPENERVVVEYVPQKGDGLVSGEVTPQHLEIVRQDFHLNRHDNRALDWLNPLIKELLRLEKLAGQPVDVEWAVSEQQVYFLQYRPITTLRRVIIWTRENVGEVIPDVVTPFTWSILEPITNGAYRYFLKKTGLKIGAQKLFTLYHGRVYFNHNAYQKMVNAFYVSSYIVPGRRKIINLLKASKLLLLLARLWYLSFRLPGQIEGILKKQEKKFRALKNSARGKGDFRAVKTAIKMIDRLMKVHVCATILAEFYYQLLNKICHETLDDAQIDASRLLQGVGQVESTKSALALWEIAHWIRQNKRYRAIFEKESVEQLIKWWRQLPSSDVFKQQLELFMENFGYAALHEFEISYPRWHEEPAYVFGALKQYVRSEEGYAAVNRQYKQMERERQIIVERVRNEIGSRDSRAKLLLFNYLLKKAEYLSFQREFLKQKILRWLDLLKQNLLSIGERMAGDGSEIFYLELKEVEMLLKNQQAQERLNLLIKQRKAQRKKYLREKYPPKIRQIGAQWTPIFEKSAADSGLRGLACSAGVVEGRACVIVDVEREGSRFTPGDILVTRATNPGWTPVLALAGGIITELGGALSHGAIIAREFGIPMVAAVSGATEKIQTGQWIKLNGQSGTIEIVKEVVE
ncbi:PEP-utilizing protein mobile region [Caldithrix abyssi DSM 13497]|uniref:PEP-utilizing protein mobile region n=1 Tax=Caldithrix abyssi DSM 13497 TaxID=880073 RepID=H1XXF4_CALAY|nr:PEP/pyruvate-binding domain-containing protein [Caldithrix abyssi]APF17872.1 Pyruvate phosphate dikinase, PEP/pyruvate binding domain [Caldithrix abyssi DSM 13497]EHO41939.1 PEP-utilizing protein mobile region [Caldithrix abyssi DSM 13497]